MGSLEDKVRESGGRRRASKSKLFFKVKKRERPRGLFLTVSEIKKQVSHQKSEIIPVIASDPRPWKK